jgi:putative FmdB family regulatory protein
MPTYDYGCVTCGIACERYAAVDDRDKQLCECGAVLTRRLSRVQIVIPAAWGTSKEDVLPSNDHSRKTWRDEGIEPVGSRMV